MKSYKYRLYPNKDQINKLFQTLNSQRNLYNQALEQRIKEYEKDKKGINYFKQCLFFKDIRKAQYPFINASSLQHLLRKLDKAFNAFFRRCKKGEDPGFPRFKTEKRFNSFEYTYTDGCKIKNNKLYLQNIGDIKIKFHRPIPENTNIKHIIVKRHLRKWYVFFMIDFPVNSISKTENPSVGIDVGIKHFLSFSDGRVIDSPKFFIKSQKILRKKQRSLSRKKKGSNRRKKQSFLVAKFHDKIANQRLDFNHKVANFVANTYGDVILEKLPLKFMIKNRHLSKYTADTAIGAFRKILEYKVENTGNQVIYVKPHYTSQRCSKCGEIVKKSLSIRTHICPSCGLVEDRDVNAALNILQLGTSCQELTYNNG